MPRIMSAQKYKVIYWQCPQDLADLLESLRLEEQAHTGTRIPMGHILAQLLKSHPTITRMIQEEYEPPRGL